MTGNLLKKLRATGTFREAMIPVGDYNLKVAVVDGLTGLEKLRSMLASGIKYDLVEVMTCPGGCVHGAGLSFNMYERGDKGQEQAYLSL